MVNPSTEPLLISDLHASVTRQESCQYFSDPQLGYEVLDDGVSSKKKPLERAVSPDTVLNL